MIASRLCFCRKALALVAALKPLGETPRLFQVWADGEGDDVYTNKDYAAFGLTPAEDTRNAVQSTGRMAGAYLAALVFHRYFTGRSGAEATHRPWGLRREDAAMLVRLNGA